MTLDASHDHSDEAQSTPEVLIDAPALVDLLGSAQPPALLDVRWALGDPLGHQHYLDAHIPGAVYVDPEHDLAAPGSPQAGRHPLPHIDELQAAARRWGVRQGQCVVVYDDTSGLAAARAWWLLLWAGVNDVRILDGGLKAWRATGSALDCGHVHPEPGDVVLTPGAMPVVDIDEVAALAQDDAAIVLDARAGERYRGEVEPIDPRAGHIPGAISAPTTQNLTAGGYFADATTLAERFTSLGVNPGQPIAVYCGSGVTAAHEVAALRIAGFTAALYPGSWSQWSHTPRPAATT